MAGPGQQAAERTDPGSRASNSSSGRTSAAADAGRAAAKLRNNFPGYRGPIGTANPDTSSAGVSQEPLNSGLVRTGQTTPWGAPVRLNSEYGIKVALSPQQFAPWQDQINKYNEARRAWNARTIADRALNFFAPFGFGAVVPSFNRPATYTGGDYHTGWNPAAAAGGVAGSMIGPGVGMITGPLAGLAGQGHELMITGPDVPAGWDPRGGTPYSPNQDRTSDSQWQNSGGKTAASGTIPGPVRQAPVSIFTPFAEQSAQQPAPPAPPIFPVEQRRVLIPGGSTPYYIDLFQRRTA